MKQRANVSRLSRQYYNLAGAAKPFGAGEPMIDDRPGTFVCIFAQHGGRSRLLRPSRLSMSLGFTGLLK